MNNYINILSEAIPGITAEDIDQPLNEIGVQSLDSIVLRGTLESYFGFEIPDNDWYGFKTLSETLAYCNNRRNCPATAVSQVPKVASCRSLEINMPKMANKALSENWLLKELGDMHWEMLSKGLEQKSSEFSDGLGNRLYAAFVRIRYSVSPLDKFRENEVLHLNSEIRRYGNQTYCSSVNGYCGHKTVTAELMTSFSARKTSDNSQLGRGCPEERTNHIAPVETTPDFYTEHRLVKKGFTDEIYSGGYSFKVTDDEIESLSHTLNPYYEINGVGLVYFAVYPIIADRCASEFFRNTMNMNNYDKEYHTIHRDTFYFANCNADDKIIVRLNSAEVAEGNKLKIATSLYRESDNTLMARIFTVKQK
jgi:probable biosynthetic protein (TIGR04098 family)